MTNPPIQSYLSTKLMRFTEEQKLVTDRLVIVKVLVDNFLNVNPTNIIWCDVEDMQWVKEKLDEIIVDFKSRIKEKL